MIEGLKTQGAFVEYVRELDDRGPVGWEMYKLDYDPAIRGPWEIQRFDIPQFDRERINTVLRQGEKRDPGWGNGFTKLVKNSPSGVRTVWMSDTKAEIVEHWPFIDQLRFMERTGTKYRVLINGLGLGMAVNAALIHGAAHIDVIEKDKRIAALVGKKFADRPQVHIHIGDAYTFTWPPKQYWDVVWHDIWPEINAGNVPQMGFLHRKYGRRSGWQDSWMREYCIEARAEIKEEIRINKILLGTNSWEIPIKRQRRKKRRTPPPF